MFPVLYPGESALIPRGWPVRAPSVTAVLPPGEVLSLPMVPLLVILPVPVRRVVVAPVIRIGHLVVMLFPVDVSIRFIVHSV